jgi:hypothetical protein
MSQTNPLPTKRQKIKTKFNIFLIFLLPLLVAFDVIIYFATRSSCLTCGNIGEFIRTSSLSFFTVVGFVELVKQKKK